VPPTPLEAVNRVAAEIATAKRWKFRKDRNARHAGFFVRRRASVLVNDYSHWLSEPDLASLKGRLNSEIGQIEAFLAIKLGTRRARGPLFGGSGDRVPAHLDPADVARRRTSEPATTVAEALARQNTRVRARTVQHLDKRHRRVSAIVWRAAAIHALQLWTPSANGKTATLATAAFDQLVDRRLRTVERMNYNIASARSWGGPGKLSITGPDGPWLDGFRVRMFEYPRVPNTQIYRTAIGAKLRPAGHRALFDGAYDWAYSTDNKRLEREVPPKPGAYFRAPTVAVPARDDLRRHIHQDPGPDPDPDRIWRSLYRLRIQPVAPTTKAQVIDLVFRSHVDWWERTWIWCDHTIAALHLESLLHAIRRRTGSDAEFNTIGAAKPPGYMSFDAVVDGHGSDEFLTDSGDTRYFENLTVDLADLQVGDHLIFWNSPLYGVLSDGDWRLENALIMDVDSDPGAATVNVDGLVMQGHGTGEKIYARFQREIAGHLKEPFQAAQHAAASTSGSAPVAFRRVRLVKWAPYDTFSAPGAWWIELPASTWGSVSDALAAVRKSVARDPAPAAGYVPPPRSDAVYFPLWEPEVPSVTVGGAELVGWQAFIYQRKADAAFRAPRKLRKVVLDKEAVPGLFQGTARRVPILRPRVIP
jgi:hypothetical protein